jgi:hypothetical protein
MIIIKLLAISVLFTSYLAIGTFSGDQCVAKGFETTILNCKTCDVILRIVGDEEIVSDCKACCQTYADVSQRYEMAVLELDKRILPNLPEIEKITKQAKKNNLTVVAITAKSDISGFSYVHERYQYYQ